MSTKSPLYPYPNSPSFDTKCCKCGTKIPPGSKAYYNPCYPNGSYGTHGYDAKFACYDCGHKDRLAFEQWQRDNWNL
jgi:hypothetical protein